MSDGNKRWLILFCIECVLLDIFYELNWFIFLPLLGQMRTGLCFLMAGSCRMSTKCTYSQIRQLMFTNCRCCWDFHNWVDWHGIFQYWRVSLTSQVWLICSVILDFPDEQNQVAESMCKLVYLSSPWDYEKGAIKDWTGISMYLTMKP